MKFSFLSKMIIPLSLAAFTFGCDTAAKKQVADFEKIERQERQNLEIFDDLDFNVFSNQKWEDLHKSHSNDVIVHWPDGRTTRGLDAHVADLKAMFVYAPDTKIQVHPIKIAREEWTAVQGEMEGTFTKPMQMGKKKIKPTGKHFKISMVTIGRWENGVMAEEWLYWDNQSFMKQIGLAK